MECLHWLSCALATGSPVIGAVVMIAFGIGTIPGLAGFGVATRLIGMRAQGMLLKAGAVIIIAAGASLLIRSIPLLHG
ncbi:MAG TPA: sulfite exporter TauE/SafE family protein [Candidatus Aquicultor sp.]